MGSTSSSIKRSHETRTAFLACLTAAALLAPPAGHAAPGNQPRLKSLVVTDLTGDPTVRTCAPDSLFRVLLAREKFVDGEPAQGITGGYRIYANPFHLAGAGGEPLDVRLELELEQASYAAPGVADKDLLSFWWFGVFSWVLKAPDNVVGLVQWRARLHWAGQDAPLEVVGVGYSPGRARDLSRAVALRLANKRALWDLGAKVARTVNKTMALEDHDRLTNMRAREYRELVDGW